MSSDPLESTTAPLPIPTEKPTSPPLDPSKLNQQPVALPTTSAPTLSDPITAPLRSSENSVSDSAYLDTGVPVETPSHPTIAETGALSPVTSRDGPGPAQGQLKRVEGGEKAPKEIIKLGSFGGEGLQLKPPVGSPNQEEKPQGGL